MSRKKLKSLRSKTVFLALLFFSSIFIGVLGLELSNSLSPHPAAYDKTVSYTTYDPIDLAYDKDRNVIWMANHYVAGLSKIDFVSMALIANISFPASMQPYRVVYDGTSVWILTAPDTYPPGNGAPASIIRVNPDTLAWTSYTFPNDAGHMFGCALSISYSPTTGGEYIFAGLGSNSTNYHAYVERFDPITFPNNITEVDLRNTGVGHYDTQIREIVYDGSTIWVGGDAGRIYTADIDSMNITYIGRPTIQSVFSGGWDGEYLWWGLNNGSIIKMNPVTHTSVLMNLQNAIRLIHRWTYDGNGYMWTFDYTSGYVYIINCATMEYNIFPIKFESPHAILYAGNYIWIADNTTESAPPSLARLSRYYLHEPAQHFDQGITGSVPVNSTGTITMAVTFNQAFTSAPTVVVSLCGLSGNTAVIVNVQATSIATTGFTLSAQVTTAGGSNATAEFSWIATDRYMNYP
jgi:hypothetical protein